MQRTLGLCAALCLGFTGACVKVDVSVKLSDTSRLSRPQLEPEKPPIPIEKLKERHVGKKILCPSSSSLDIKGEKQQTAAWCWAASTRTVMKYHNINKVQPEATVPQCDIVKNIFGPWLGRTNCCEVKVTPDFIAAPSACVRGGWPYWVLTKYQFDYEWVDGPFDDWDALKGEICKVGPFISVIEWKGGGKHTFIVNGYRESPTNARLKRVVEVYDPLEDDPQDLTFDEFIGDAAKKQGRSYEFSHDRTYVQILPKPESRP